MKRSPLRSKAPLRANPAAVKAWRERTRAPLPRVNSRRIKRLREDQFAVASGYHRFVMEQPCAACGSFDPDLRSDPAHVGRTRGAGAKADRVLSLCRPCHLWEESNSGFDEAFTDRHGVTPEEMAAYRFEIYHREH
jgi:hypothetical protein